MNLFQRITATFTSKLENVVSHVENHDAVVEVALKDTRAAMAKSRVRLTRVQKDGEALRQRLSELESQSQNWEERAKAIAKTDKAKALECIERRNRCQTEEAQVTKLIAQHDELEAKLGASVTRMEQRLGELTQQRNLLRSRHSTADAMRVIHRMEAETNQYGVEDVFDRWEMQILEAEYETGSTHPVDTLEAEFTSKESQDSLEADLEALLNDKPQK